MSTIHIPTLLFWENGNSWYGSMGSARFFIRPEKPEDGGEPQLTVQLWRGPLTMELSEIIASASFPLTEAGLARTSAWLEERAAELN